MSGDFTPEQKRYLEGFSSGLQVARVGRPATTPGAAAPAVAPVKPTGPDAPHLEAMARFEAQERNSPIRKNGSARNILSMVYGRLKDQAEKRPVSDAGR